MTEAGASVGADIAINQGEINTRKLEAIDAAHQLHSIVKRSLNFTNIGKNRNRLIAAGRPPRLKDRIDEGSVQLSNKYLVNQIIISALGEGRHDGKLSKLDSHANMIVVGSQGSIFQATG